MTMLLVDLTTSGLIAFAVIVGEKIKVDRPSHSHEPSQVP